MRTIARPGAILGTMFVLLNAAPAHSQTTGTWVSNAAGDDINPCSYISPCKTFAGAIGKTAINGVIRCLDPGSYGAVTIPKSVTINCHDTFAYVLASGATGITINLNTTLAQDPLQTVRLINLQIDGTGSCGTDCGTRTGLRGIHIVKANQVFLDGLLISNFVNEGIRDARTGSGNLYIRNSVVMDNGGNGIAVVAAQAVAAAVDHSHSNRNANGIAVGNLQKVMVNRSVFSGNTTGIQSDSGGLLSVSNSTITGNSTGVLATAGSTVRLSNNDISFNTTGISGATTSFGSNRIYPTVGAAPTAAGADSHDKGEL